MRKAMENQRTHLTIDNIVINLLTDYHNLTHSQVVAYYRELISQSIQSEGNIANEDRYPKMLFRKAGKPVYKTTKIDEETKLKNKNYVYNPFNSDVSPHNLIWVVRGFYPGSNVPFKLSIVLNRELGFEHQNYYCKVTLGDKLSSTCFKDQHIEAYQEEVIEAALLDKDVKKLNQIPYNRKVFRCMRPKSVPLLKKKI